jgi:hypothetical protein
MFGIGSTMGGESEGHARRLLADLTRAAGTVVEQDSEVRSLLRGALGTPATAVADLSRRACLLAVGSKSRKTDARPLTSARRTALRANRASITAAGRRRRTAAVNGNRNPIAAAAVIWLVMERPGSRFPRPLTGSRGYRTVL